jgi:hypothetical protein
MTANAAGNIKRMTVPFTAGTIAKGKESTNGHNSIYEWIVTNTWWMTSDLGDSAVREEDISQRKLLKHEASKSAKTTVD